MPLVVASLLKKNHIVGFLLVFGPASLVAGLVGNGWEVSIVWFASVLTLCASCALVFFVLPNQTLESDPTVCHSCNYDLKGLPDNITKCPECGKTMDEKQTASSDAPSTIDV